MLVICAVLYLFCGVYYIYSLLLLNINPFCTIMMSFHKLSFVLHCIPIYYHFHGKVYKIRVRLTYLTQLPQSRPITLSFVSIWVSGATHTKSKKKNMELNENWMEIEWKKRYLQDRIPASIIFRNISICNLREYKRKRIFIGRVFDSFKVSSVISPGNSIRLDSI